MSGKVAITSQIMAAKTRPNGTIHSLFMTTSCDSVLAHQGAVVSPNLLGLRRPDLVVPRRRRAPRWQPHLVTCSAFRPCWGADPGYLVQPVTRPERRYPSFEWFLPRWPSHAAGVTHGAITIEPMR